MNEYRLYTVEKQELLSVSHYIKRKGSILEDSAIDYQLGGPHLNFRETPFKIPRLNTIKRSWILL